MKVRITKYGDAILEPTSDADHFVLERFADYGVTFKSSTYDDDQAVVTCVIIGTPSDGKGGVS